MNLYEEIGVRPFINAGGWMFTRYGGSIMPEAVLAAMTEASKQFVNLFELQDRMGEALAAMTNNESAFVSCGAASGILLAVAACIAGTDADLANRLPDTQGMRNQVIMRSSDRGTEADPAIRAAGGKIVEIGMPGRIAGVDELLGAINDQTAAILLVGFESKGNLNISPVVEGAGRRNIPVLLDGACAVPPKHNLWRYTRDLGADALIVSGGKAIRGPQSTGLVLGKRSIIEGCKYHASPNLRIGRGMKVGKEEFAGIYTAVKLFLAEDAEAQAALKKKQIACIVEYLKDIPGLKLSAQEGSQVQIDIDPAISPTTAEAAAKALLAGNPSILLPGRENRITVRSTLLQTGEEKIVGERLRKILNANAR
jgi:L-seryl-tRNA(Ser) seleniumtransferase